MQVNTESTVPPFVPVVLGKLTKDMRTATATLTPKEARFLVDLYYTMQDERIRQANQVRSLRESGEPHNAIAWVLGQSESLERSVQAMLDAYTKQESTGMGQWARAIVGIGPVIAAGLVANIDITRAPTAGHIWRFAGLDPTQEWKKGEKRPWNASLKVLCWKLGESFVKVSGNERDVYGKVYAARKAYEIAQSESGALAAQAKAKLDRFKIGADTEARKWYEQGKLPPAHLHARAKRYAVKLFLSHYHGEAYRRHFGTEPPLPYPIAHLNHAHLILPPD
jgi:hypothetical protein